jgi:Putative peptidoglycan binding domain
MPQEPKPRSLDEQLDDALESGLAAACAAAEATADLPAGILLAICSRETGCVDRPADGGRRRGAFGLDERSHAEWLARVGALAPGEVPDAGASATYVASLLTAHVDFGRANGVRQPDLLRFAVAALDAGPAATLEAYRHGGDPDAATTGGDYGRDVLERLAAVRRWRTRRGANPPVLPRLEPGSTHPAVVELKRRLRAWYVNSGRRPPRRMRGPSYGTSAVDAVREFQRSSGLDPDGIVGPETWQALGKAADGAEFGSSTAA